MVLQGTFKFALCLVLICMQSTMNTYTCRRAMIKWMTKKFNSSIHYSYIKSLLPWIKNRIARENSLIIDSSWEWCICAYAFVFFLCTFVNRNRQRKQLWTFSNTISGFEHTLHVLMNAYLRTSTFWVIQ